MLNGEKKSPLEAITYLKKLCGHPTLVSKRFTGDTNDIQGNLENTSVEELLQQSQKLQALSALIAALTKAGHRVLIFSQSTRMLDIIQRVLRKVARMSRIDGSTKERDRQRLVDDFNNPKSNYCCMLLSTKAGGLGLTLTGADRAIIYDPSWNPAEDSQAVDRCYRYAVYVNKLLFMPCGTFLSSMNLLLFSVKNWNNKTSDDLPSRSCRYRRRENV